LSNAFTFADDRNIGLSDPQWNGPSYSKERQSVNDDSLTFLKQKWKATYFLPCIRNQWLCIDDPSLGQSLLMASKWCKHLVWVQPGLAVWAGRYRCPGSGCCDCGECKLWLRAMSGHQDFHIYSNSDIFILNSSIPQLRR
jgi:hypothetical protein